VVGDALHLPFADDSFDVVSVAFGLRNMADWGAALREMARVSAPAGHVLVLDFSLPRGFLRTIYRGYLHRILPRIAAVVTGEQDAYKYLGDSIEQFPQGRTMCGLIERSGFVKAQAEPLSAGIVTIYHATK
jgi:demethylmenaquinone methyltransferase/2-methoxy-6-polyprenyl-1,4-benzoquinol methylase